VLYPRLIALGVSKALGIRLVTATRLVHPSPQYMMTVVGRNHDDHSQLQLMVKWLGCQNHNHSTSVGMNEFLGFFYLHFLATVSCCTAILFVNTSKFECVCLCIPHRK